ncbi:DUF3422 family protein [Rhodobacteraceae bacterium CCMM004]|nr:DUF3422 family protein [Rhodobacteraceae bacterium CCMM004]
MTFTRQPYNDFTEQYPDIRDASHQRPSSLCSPNSVVRYQAWWLENDWLAQSDTDDPTNHNKLHSDIESIYKYNDKLTYRFMTHLSDRCQKWIKHEGRHQSFTEEDYRIISGLSERLIHHTFIVQRTSRTVQLTHIIDTERDNDRRKTREDNELDTFREGPLPKALSTISRLQGLYPQHHEHTDDSGFWSSSDGDSAKVATSFLYDEIWAEVDRKIVEVAFDAPETTLAVTRQSKLKKFAEFRGIIIPSHESELIRSTDAARSAIERNWFIVKSSEYEVEDGKLISTKDFVASTVRDSSAIYVSSIGQLSKTQSINSTSLATEPIRYLLLVEPGRNYRQIGRIIDRLHRLGTYRCLSLRDYKKLTTVSEEIKRLGSVLSFAEENIGNKGFSEFISNRIDQVGRDIESGLSYRLSSANRHIDEMNAQVASMKFGNIPGFESYQDFVTRQVGIVHVAIKEMDRRVDRMRRRIGVVLLRNQLAAIKSISSTIAKANWDVSSVLRAGEWIEAIAVTYYGGIILGKAWVAIQTTKVAAEYEILLHLSAFGAWLILRRLLHRRDERSKKE